MTINEFQSLQRQYAKGIEEAQTTIYVCTGSQCIAGGAFQIYETLQILVKQLGILVKVTNQAEKIEPNVTKTGCQGLCGKGPLVTILPQGILYVGVQQADCREILEKTILKGEVIKRLLYLDYQDKEAIPFYQKQRKEVLALCGKVDPESIHDYIAFGGYTGFIKALDTLEPVEICDEILKSNLRGRGGAAFLAGKKWKDVLKRTDPIKYIICNGDEGNPGAFKDGGIMEGIPHSILEGMAIAGYATGASHGYIYVRAEYPLAIKRLKIAIEQAREFGILGANILGTDFSFDISINKGAGAYVCGEGGALVASIEGKRGIPRVKPPRTTEKGLFQKPTILNNVESFATVPLIIKNSGEWFRAIGPENSPGTKVFSVGGNVKLGSMVEVEMGTTIRELIYGICDGIEDDKALKAVQMGGPSGVCMPASQLDVPLDFDSLEAVDGMMGAGGVVIFDESICMVEIARYFMKFTKGESCGKCTSCREGSRKMLDLLDKIVDGDATMEDLETIEHLAHIMTKYSLCGLGKTAATPVISTIANFREEYISHIIHKKCVAGSCNIKSTSQDQNQSLEETV